MINDSQIYEKIADTGFAKVVDFHDDRRFFLLYAVKSVMQMESRFLKQMDFTAVDYEMIIHYKIARCRHDRNQYILLNS